MKKSTFILLLVIIIGLGLNSCSKNDDFKSSIKGTWDLKAAKLAGMSDYLPIDQLPGWVKTTMTFGNDKKCYLNGVFDGIQAYYKVKDHNTIEIYTATLTLFTLPVSNLTPTDMEVHLQYKAIDGYLKFTKE